MLQDTVNFGCFLITGLWMVLLAWWPGWMAAAGAALLTAFVAAARQRLRGLAALSAATFVLSALAVFAIRWAPTFSAANDAAAWPATLAAMLAVPLPLIALFVAVSVMQALWRDSPGGG